MFRFVLATTALTLASTAHAEPCTYAGNVAAYVGCIADQASDAWDLAQANEAAIAAMSSPEEWTDATYEDGWASYGTSWADAGYFKDSAGVVHLRGLVTDGVQDTTIFTLPEGYRPARRAIFGQLHGPNAEAGIARVDILTDGGVYVNTLPGTGTWITLEGITFRAAE